MIEFILNDQQISTNQGAGSTVLDFVRYHKNLKGTKIGCREGDCGACTILVGELIDDDVRYRSMTSCLMPLANAAGKHIVTIEGINPADGSLTPVQQAMVDESGTQCGFCTVGFVMSLTGFCLGTPAPLPAMVNQAISSVDGNICRCTGYKSIERAAEKICSILSEPPASAGGRIVPEYFLSIKQRLALLQSNIGEQTDRPLTQAVPTGGGTDLYVQRPDQMAEGEGLPLFYNEGLRSIRDTGEYIAIGASVTVTDLLESPVMQSIFPNLYKHLKLVSSTPIRNMATLAGNFVNASPIGDMTIWFLALDAEVDLSATCGSVGVLSEPPALAGGKIDPTDTVNSAVNEPRTTKLRDFYLGYKKLAKQPNEIITSIHFRKPTSDFRFNFEKVCKRTYLDIATVNTAISLERRYPAGSSDQIFETVHIAAGGVAPVPLYLKETSEFLRGRRITKETITEANELLQSEISPISDVRGTSDYKRLLLQQLFIAHFLELSIF